MDLYNFSETEWEAIAIRKELKEKELKKENEELDRLLAMPFHLRIQAHGQEETLKRVEAVQSETFKQHSAKKWNIPKKDIDDLFAEFFTEFLNGKTESIRDFLIARGFKKKENDK